jgi:hypothetical protein
MNVVGAATAAGRAPPARKKRLPCVVFSTALHHHSALGTPGLVPTLTFIFLIHDRKVSRVQPILEAIDCIADHRDA